MSKNRAGLAVLIVFAIALFVAALAHAAGEQGSSHSYTTAHTTAHEAPAVDTIDALSRKNGIAPLPGSDLVCGRECAATE
jgi:hypothetical protein